MASFKVGKSFEKALLLPRWSFSAVPSFESGALPSLPLPPVLAMFCPCSCCCYCKAISYDFFSVVTVSVALRPEPYAFRTAMFLPSGVTCSMYSRGLLILSTWLA